MGTFAATRVGSKNPKTMSSWLSKLSYANLDKGRHSSDAMRKYGNNDDPVVELSSSCCFLRRASN